MASDSEASNLHLHPYLAINYLRNQKNQTNKQKNTFSHRCLSTSAHFSLRSYTEQAAAHITPSSLYCDITLKYRCWKDSQSKALENKDWGEKIEPNNSITENLAIFS